MTLFITRPSPDAEATCSALKTIGVEALPTPLMEVVFMDADLPSVSPDTLLIFTSANGVRAWRHHRGPSLPAIVVGPATETVARETGLNVEAVAGGDVDRLFDLLTRQPKVRPLLHIRGVHGTGDLAGRLQEAGFRAEGLALYEARAAEALPDQLMTALKDGGHAVGLFSPRSMKLFLQLTTEAGLTDALRRMDAYCLSHAVAAADQGKAFRARYITKNPDLAAFVDSVRSRLT